MKKVQIKPSVKERKMNHSKSRSKRMLEPPKVTPIFKNKTVFIVGGGSSLTGFDFNKLKGKSIIVINKGFMTIPFAQVLYFSDYRFYIWYKDVITSFKGLIYTIANKVLDEKITILKNTGKKGFDPINGCVRHGGNSGYAAINLAYHLGAKEIVLMGYDMGSINGSTHFHDGYKSKQNDSVYNRFKEPYSALKNEIAKAGITIYNVSLKSQLDVFPKRNIEYFL